MTDKLKIAIETLGRLKHYIQTDVNRYGGGWDSIVEAIDTVVKELEKPLPCERCKKLEYMIENGLGWKDMENDISPMHEL